MNWFERALNDGVREGMHLAFEKNAFENCDGKGDPDDRCPSSGHCVCVYMRWKSLPWWRSIFAKQPPRADVKTCQAIVIDRMVEEAWTSRAAPRGQK